MQHVIFDTDLGIDDALALLYLLGSPEVRVDAITTVHGNVPVEQATQNVFEVLAVANPGFRPIVAKGSALPLEDAGVNATEVHGADGLGGWTVGRERAPGELSNESAADTITRLATERRGEMRLLLLGPATNAALALKRDREGFRLLHDVVMMGGAVEKPGNVTAVAEFNVYADPEAAQGVLRAGVPVTIVSLDVTREVILTRELVAEKLGNRQDRKARFVRCVCEQGFRFYSQTTGRHSMYLHDPLAAGVLADPTLVDTRRMRVDVELRGELTRGMTVAERRPSKTGSENVDVCVAVDVDRYLSSFCERVFQE